MNSKYYNRKTYIFLLDKLHRACKIPRISPKELREMDDWKLLQHVDDRLLQLNCFTLSPEELNQPLK